VGCIYTFLLNDGVLDLDRIRILRRCASDLQRVSSQLDGASCDYFNQLAEMIIGVLEQATR
jgi:hypothetical protein